MRENMNAVPALIAATQRPRELTRKELSELASLLDERHYSEGMLRAAYGRARNADIAAHIIGFVRPAALGDPLVPYKTRVENAILKIEKSRPWTPKQKSWLRRMMMEWCDLHTILRLPTGIFYAQGVKTNVIFLRRGTHSADRTEEVWVYDLRAQMPAFGKTNPLTAGHFTEFVAAYGDGPNGKGERKD